MTFAKLDLDSCSGCLASPASQAHLSQLSHSRFEFPCLLDPCNRFILITQDILIRPDPLSKVDLDCKVTEMMIIPGNDLLKPPVKSLFDTRLFMRHPMGLTSSQFSKLKPLVKFRVFQTTNDKLVLFYYNRRKKGRI